MDIPIEVHDYTKTIPDCPDCLHKGVWHTHEHRKIRSLNVMHEIAYSICRCTKCGKYYPSYDKDFPPSDQYMPDVKKVVYDMKFTLRIGYTEISRRMLKLYNVSITPVTVRQWCLDMKGKV